MLLCAASVCPFCSSRQLACGFVEALQLSLNSSEPPLNAWTSQPDRLNFCLWLRMLLSIVSESHSAEAAGSRGLLGLLS